MSEMPPRPRVSILVPNFNNGRASSHDGSIDFITDLFESLDATLCEDPTPFEIIVHDDGSSDDSLEVCRRWARKTWHDGRPFLTLTERSHCGILSITANNMTREARGDICCRHDGDIVILTPNWVTKVVETFDNGLPALGVIGPKQLTPDMRIHSAGDFILHPRGNHHLAQGAPRNFITRSIEVDHVMGCFYCHRKKVWEDVGGYDVGYLRGQTVDFGLMARLNGWRTFSVPHIEFVHRHSLRRARDTRADTNEGVDVSRRHFEQKWGFDRIAPDLDIVRNRYARTPLLWNASVFGPHVPLVDNTEPPRLETSEWVKFAHDEVSQKAIRHRLEIARLASQGRAGILQIGCGGGLLCHLLAKEGAKCTGVDGDPASIDLARSVTGRERYPTSITPPQFVYQSDPARLPFDDGSFESILLFDVIERPPNPVGLLREAHRVLKEQGHIAIVSRKRQGIFEGQLEGVHWFRAHELEQLVIATRLFAIANVERAIGDQATLALVARRREQSSRTARTIAEVKATELKSSKPTIATP